MKNFSLYDKQHFLKELKTDNKIYRNFPQDFKEFSEEKLNSY